MARSSDGACWKILRAGGVVWVTRWKRRNTPRAASYVKEVTRAFPDAPPGLRTRVAGAVQHICFDVVFPDAAHAEYVAAGGDDAGDRLRRASEC